MRLLQVEPSFFWTIWPLGSSNPDHSLSLCTHCPCCQTRVTRGVQQLRVCLADNLTFVTSSFGFLTSVAFDLDPGNPQASLSPWAAVHWPVLEPSADLWNLLFPFLFNHVGPADTSARLWRLFLHTKDGIFAFLCYTTDYKSQLCTWMHLNQLSLLWRKKNWITKGFWPAFPAKESPLQFHICCICLQ